MHKLCGFALFWLAVGMTLSLLIESTFFCGVHNSNMSFGRI